MLGFYDTDRSLSVYAGTTELLNEVQHTEGK
jgi:hypothetical protein